MKNLIAILALNVFYLTSFGQLPIDAETGKVVYTEVVDLNGLNKKDIYQKAKLWVVSNLKAGDNMVELEGSNSDQIVGTGNLVFDDIPTGYGNGKRDKITSVNLNFKFIVFIKDGKYKYEVSNFLLTYKWLNAYVWQEYSSDLIEIAPAPLLKKETDIEEYRSRIKSTAHSALNSLIQDFKSAMSKSQSSEDW